MTLLIDTAVVPARERLDFWWEESWGAYHPLQIRSAARERFFARMWAYELGPLGFFRIAAAPNAMARTSKAIAAGRPGMPACLGHPARAARDGAERAACRRATGRRRQLRHVAPSCLPRGRLVRSARDAGAARPPRAGTPTRSPGARRSRIHGGNGFARPAAAFLRGLFGGLRGRDGRSADASGAVDCVLDVVRSLYRQSSRAWEPTRPRSRAEILLNVKSYVEANLGNPDLDPADISRASFISTRYLHKLFEAEGISVGQWIRSERLDRCRRDLVDPSLRSQTILEIASRWGLTGPQHFSRLFRSTYGCSPSDYRRATDAEGAAVTVPCESRRTSRR